MRKKLLLTLLPFIIGCVYSCTPSLTETPTDDDKEEVVPPVDEDSTAQDTVPFVPRPVPVDLCMEVLTEWGVGADVPLSTRAVEMSSDSIRFIVFVRPEGNDTVMEYVYRQSFKEKHTEDDKANDEGYVVNMELLPGRYAINVWADYMVQSPGASSPYYTFPDFGEVALSDTTYTINSTDKDAFCGAASIIIDSLDQEVSLPMNLHRPFSRLEVVLCDTTWFLKQERERLQLAANAKIDFSTYRACLTYYGFLPSAYNLQHGKPCDSRIGVASESVQCITDKSSVILAYDYIFTGTNKTTMKVGAEMYDPSGIKVHEVEPIDVPLMRNGNTSIKIW